MSKVLVRPRGLVVDSNAIAPTDGDLRVAEHVVLDQPGVVRARPTNSLYLDKDTDDGEFRPVAMIHDGELHAVSYSGSEWRFEDEGATLLSGFDIPTQAQTARISTARSSIYFTTDTGLRKHISGDAAPIYAGVEPLPIIYGSGDHGLVLVGSLPSIETRLYLDTAANGGAVAGDVIEWWKTRGTSYQEFVTVKRTDANGYVRRSPPARLAFTGTDVPESDAYLWATYTLTSSDISNGYAVVRVDTSLTEFEERVAFPDNDDDLGEALYTNPSQQGALGAKYAPPCAAEVAQWSGVTWYGNTLSKHRAVLTVSAVAGSQDFGDVDVDNADALLGAITATPFTGTTTSGSAVLTGVADDLAFFLRPGMYVTDSATNGPALAGTAFPADTTVVSYAAGVAPGTIDITCSANATATGLRSVYIGDVVEIGGRNFYAWRQDRPAASPDAVFGGPRRCFGVASTVITATGRNAYTAQCLAWAVNYESILDSTFRVRAAVLGEPYVYSSTVTAPSTVLLEEIGVGGDAFTVDTSAPGAFSPILPITSEDDEGPGLLWYSEPDEPEAVPLPNYFRVGDRGKPILALTPLRDSLLVWKTDGLFRVTGSAPDSWRVDPVDNHVRLVSSTCVDASEGVAYAWTDVGMVVATESGVQVISHDIDSLLKPYLRQVLDGDVLPRSAWVCCWRHERLVLLGLPSEDGGARDVMAWSPATSAWSTMWTRGDLYHALSAYYSPELARLFWSMRLAWEVRRFDSEPKGYDRAYSLSGATCSSPYTTVTVAEADAGSWYPIEGDWIKRTLSGSSSYARITGASLSVGTWTITLANALAGGSGGGATFTGYEGLPGVIEWQQAGPPPGWELVRELQAHLDSSVLGATALPGTIHLELGGSSSFAPATMISGDPADPTQYSRPYRYGAPRAAARGPHFYPRVECNALGYPWRLHELAVVGERGSERVRR